MNPIYLQIISIQLSKSSSIGLFYCSNVSQCNTFYFCCPETKVIFLFALQAVHQMKGSHYKRWNKKVSVSRRVKSWYSPSKTYMKIEKPVASLSVSFIISCAYIGFRTCCYFQGCSREGFILFVHRYKKPSLDCLQRSPKDRYEFDIFQNFQIVQGIARITFFRTCDLLEYMEVTSFRLLRSLRSLQSFSSS